MDLLLFIKNIVRPNSTYSTNNSENEQGSLSVSVFSSLIAEFDTNGDGIIDQGEYDNLEREFLEFQENVEKGVASDNAVSRFFENGIDINELGDEYNNVDNFFKSLEALDNNGDAILNLQDFYNNSANKTDKTESKTNATKTKNSNKNTTFRKEAEFYTVNKTKLNLENEYFDRLSSIDNKIDTKVNSIVKNSTLKEDYNKIRVEYSQNQKAINESDKNIINLENKIFDVDTDISYVKGQLSTISTDTEDAEINENNKQLIIQLNQKLKELQNQKIQLEEEITREKNNKNDLEIKGNNLQQQIETILDSMIQAQPELGDNIKHLRSDKKKIESEKQNKMNSIDEKAEKAKKEELEKYLTMGKNSGENFNYNNEFGEKLIEIATSEEAFKEWNGRAMSCSGFVGWCLEKLSCEVSPNMCHDIISLGKNNNAWLDVNNMSEADAKDYLAENLRQGMVFVTNTNGQLHVGFVTKVYEDGSWDTIEANTFNEETGKSRSVASHHVTYESKKDVLLGFTDIEKLNRA